MLHPGYEIVQVGKNFGREYFFAPLQVKNLGEKSRRSPVS